MGTAGRCQWPAAQCVRDTLATRLKAEPHPHCGRCRRGSEFLERCHPAGQWLTIDRAVHGQAPSSHLPLRDQLAPQQAPARQASIVPGVSGASKGAQRQAATATLSVAFAAVRKAPG